MNDLITLTCPSCGGRIKVSANPTHYKCEFCKNEHVVVPDSKLAAAQKQKRPEIAMPGGMFVDYGAQSLHIERRWFSMKYVPMAFFCVAWDAFLIFWYSMAFTANPGWIFIVFPIAHVAVGVGLTYSTLAGFLNSTKVDVDSQFVSIAHGPMPWLGDRTIATGDVKQFYTKEDRGEKGSTFDLYLMTKDNKSIKMIDGMDSVDAGLFIEQQVESWLQIDDQPVAGEFPR
jgi:hypothetical protein